MKERVFIDGNWFHINSIWLSDLLDIKNEGNLVTVEGLVNRWRLLNIEEKYLLEEFYREHVKEIKIRSLGAISKIELSLALIEHLVVEITVIKKPKKGVRKYVRKNSGKGNGSGNQLSTRYG